MKYRLEIDEAQAMAVRRGLGLLPYDEVVGLIADLGAQMAAQEKITKLPAVTTSDLRPNP